MKICYLHISMSKINKNSNLKFPNCTLTNICYSQILKHKFNKTHNLKAVDLAINTTYLLNVPNLKKKIETSRLKIADPKSNKIYSLKMTNM